MLYPTLYNAYQFVSPKQHEMPETVRLCTEIERLYDTPTQTPHFYTPTDMHPASINETLYICFSDSNSKTSILSVK